MDVATRRPSWSWLAPIRLVGRHGRATVTVAAVLVVAGAWAWWTTQLWGLPDIADPFDVQAFDTTRVVPADRNAFEFYTPASGQTRALAIKLAWERRPEPRKFNGQWSKASPAWRDFATQGRETLNLWRQGTERPESKYEHVGSLSFRTILPVSMELRTLGQLAILEGSRLEEAGDVEGAWGWYRAALRSSRHSGMHGFTIERLIGAAIHKDATEAITRWSDNPRVDAAMLRLALDKVVAIDAMTTPRSDTLKLEYLVFTRNLGGPDMVEDLLVSKDPADPSDWAQDLSVPDSAKKPIQAARVLLSDDRERTLRVFRLFTANWLAQVDRPDSRRAPLAHKNPPIYAPDPAAPPASRALSPEDMIKWHDSTLLARRQIGFLSRCSVPIDKERVRQAELVRHLTEQIERRESGNGRQ